MHGQGLLQVSLRPPRPSRRASTSLTVVRPGGLPLPASSSASSSRFWPSGAVSNAAVALYLVAAAAARRGREVRSRSTTPLRVLTVATNRHRSNRSTNRTWTHRRLNSLPLTRVGRHPCTRILSPPCQAGKRRKSERCWRSKSPARTSRWAT